MTAVSHSGFNALKCIVLLQTNNYFVSNLAVCQQNQEDTIATQDMSLAETSSIRLPAPAFLPIASNLTTNCDMSVDVSLAETIVDGEPGQLYCSLLSCCTKVIYWHYVVMTHAYSPTITVPSSMDGLGVTLPNTDESNVTGELY